MKIVQEENLQRVETQLEHRYQLDTMSCIFFIFGMLASAYMLHQYIL